MAQILGNQHFAIITFSQIIAIYFLIKSKNSAIHEISNFD